MRSDTNTTATATNSSLQGEVNAIIEPFLRREEWESLKIPGFPTPAAIVLMTGEPGTGKTTLAKAMIRKISPGIKLSEIPTMSMGDIGSGRLGETERSIRFLFKQARDLAKKKKCTPAFFMDEVESICWERANLTNDRMFMFAIVDTLLLEIDKFIDDGGAAFFATNHPEKLDRAFLSRVTNNLKLFPPVGKDALKIWKAHMPPAPFGIDLSSAPLDCLPKGWTPRKIKNEIFREARRAFLAKENMQPIKNWITE